MSRKKVYDKYLKLVKRNCINSDMPLTYQEEVFLEESFKRGWDNSKKEIIKELRLFLINYKSISIDIRDIDDELNKMVKEENVRIK